MEQTGIQINKTHMQEDPLPLRVALLDDDLIFGLVLTKFAAKNNIHVSIFKSPIEYIRGISKFNFDVAVIDYYLDNDIGTKYACLKEELPVIFTSRDDLADEIDMDSSRNVMGFIRKEKNHIKIVKGIVDAFFRKSEKR